METNRFNERMVIILFIGAVSVVALVGSLFLYTQKNANGALAVLALVTNGLSLLAPSPLSKQFVPPDPAIEEKKK